MIGRLRTKRTETSTVDKERAQMKAPMTHRNLPRFLGALAAAAACILALGAGSASAEFEILSFDGTTLDQGGEPFTQAGGHPYEVTTEFETPSIPDPQGGFFPVPDGQMKDVRVDLAPGMVGDPSATPAKCTVAQLAAGFGGFACPLESRVGTVAVATAPGLLLESGLYNMVAPPGQAAQFAGNIVALVQLGATVRSSDYGLTISSLNVPQSIPTVGVTTYFWGVPADHIGGEDRKPLLTMPTSCTGPLETTLRINSWQEPANVLTASFLSHDNEVPPNPVGNTGCENVPFEPTATVQPLSGRADSPTGLNVDVGVPTDGIKNPDGISQANVKKVEIDFPEGMAINPSVASGLGACSPDQIGLGADSPVECPDSSKIGTTEITTPLLDEPLSGSIYQAEQDNNPFNSTLALYLVAENEERGVTIKVAGEVEADANTGQLKTTFDDNPQMPFSNLNVRLNGGDRAPLVTPSSCGTYQITTKLTPWSGTETIDRTSSFQVDSGCDTGGFNPGFAAGSTNPVGGSYAPFAFDVTRNDGELNVAALGLGLPKGVSAKLAGVPLCPEPNAVAGTCPAASQVGSVSVAAGAGPQPVWVPQPGKEPTAVYLAGPYKGAPYSIVARVPAQAGPFDLGTVAVRSTVQIDPVTAQISVASDPFPQILQGIPIDYRHIHVGVDRPGFMVNPTNCAEQAVASTIVAENGGAVTPASRFQVTDCGSLGFKPKLYTRIWGKTNRGAHPKFRAILQPRKGDANIGRAAVTLPHSELLDQAHIKTVCTRVQFAANACPQGAVYGYAKAYSPLLAQVVQGPVYLRSSSHKLPDLVADLHGEVDIELSGRIDSVNGGIRTTFEAPPDVPVTKFILYMKGGKKGLLVNSTNICKGTNRSNANLRGQNGRKTTLKPVLKNNRCKGKKK